MRSALGTGVSGFVIWMAFTGFAWAAGLSPQNILELPSLDVVATSPIGGSATSMDQVPANVQRIDENQWSGQHASDVIQIMNRGLGNVVVNDTQGNGVQSDVSFRGFTASPILGTPQGLSVYFDGMRVNEAFGDTVNWDLIPISAIGKISLLPGSSAVFGLNSLGGVLTINTKSGFDYPGTTVQSSVGAFARRRLDATTGGSVGNEDYFMTLSTTKDPGWAEHNPTDARQWFGKAGYEDDVTDLDLSLAFANNVMQGNQTLPASWMSDPRQAYSWIDSQSNTMALANVQWTRTLQEHWTVSMGASIRHINTLIYNSNVNGNFDPNQPIGPQNPATMNAINHIVSDRPSFSAQINYSGSIAGFSNTVTVGTNLEHEHTAFEQEVQDAGVSRDTASSALSVLATRMDSSMKQGAIYFTDFLAAGSATEITVSGRYDYANLQLHDLLGTALDGVHSFSHFDPAIGATYKPSAGVVNYANFSEGMRIPTPIELTCADPAAPCSLPNAFSADPALLPVTARTYEAGVRSVQSAKLRWSFAVFRTDLENDLQFISASGTANNAGYFQNVGRTRRKGIELGANSSGERFNWGVNYGLTDATYQSSFYLNSPANSTSGPLTCPTCTDIHVVPGDHLPSIPRQTLKLYAELKWDEQIAVGSNITVQSGQYARGNENNSDPSGWIGGFAVLDLHAEMHLTEHWDVFASINNVLNRGYSNFAALGTNVFTGPGRSFDATGETWRNEPFLAVGAPRSWWIGATYHFGNIRT